MDKTIRSLARFEYFQIVINANNTAKARMDCLVTGHKTDFSEGNLQSAPGLRKESGRQGSQNPLSIAETPGQIVYGK